MLQFQFRPFGVPRQLSRIFNTPQIKLPAFYAVQTSLVSEWSSTCISIQAQERCCGSRYCPHYLASSSFSGTRCDSCSHESRPEEGTSRIRCKWTEQPLDLLKASPGSFRFGTPVAEHSFPVSAFCGPSMPLHGLNWSRSSTHRFVRSLWLKRGSSQPRRYPGLDNTTLSNTKEFHLQAIRMSGRLKCWRAPATLPWTSLNDRWITASD